MAGSANIPIFCGDPLREQASYSREYLLAYGKSLWEYHEYLMGQKRLHYDLIRETKQVETALRAILQDLTNSEISAKQHTWSSLLRQLGHIASIASFFLSIESLVYPTPPAPGLPPEVILFAERKAKVGFALSSVSVVATAQDAAAMDEEWEEIRKAVQQQGPTGVAADKCRELIKRNSEVQARLKERLRLVDEEYDTIFSYNETWNWWQREVNIFNYNAGWRINNMKNLNGRKSPRGY